MKIVKKFKKYWKKFKKTRIYESLVWFYKNFFKISVITILLMIVIPFYIDRQNAKDELQKRRQLVYAENIYNQENLGLFKHAIKNDYFDQSLFTVPFSLSIYRDNWDIIAELTPECSNNLLFAMGRMEAINSMNDRMASLYIQETFALEEAQIKNSQYRTNLMYQDLERNILELERSIDRMIKYDCRFE